eukprot:6166626-Amphidinium_carterae.3
MLLPAWPLLQDFVGLFRPEQASVNVVMREDIEGSFWNVRQVPTRECSLKLQGHGQCQVLDQTAIGVICCASRQIDRRIEGVIVAPCGSCMFNCHQATQQAPGTNHQHCNCHMMQQSGVFGGWVLYAFATTHIQFNHGRIWCSVTHAGRQPVDRVCNVDSLQLVCVVVLRCAMSQFCNGTATCPCEACLPTHLASRSGDDCERRDVPTPVNPWCQMSCCMFCGLTRDVPAVGEQELKRRLGEAENVEDELASALHARKRMQRVMR